ncbi:MAG TPA: PilZ domain-containing protein [Terriglobales bacterium]|nr:PilZ domain-containing protein [Terriglobales bacterium]
MKRTDGVPGPSAPARREPRRYPRYNMNLKVAVQVFREGVVESLWGRCNEIGQDGMSATLTGELQPGEVATLEFTLPATVLATRLRAAVRYRNGYRHGFEFLTLTDGQRQAIQRALAVAEELT